MRRYKLLIFAFFSSIGIMILIVVYALMASQQIPFFRFAMNQSIAQKGYFDEHPLRGRTLKDFDAIARNSLKRQQEIEAADTVGFDEFLEAYLAFK